MAFALRIRNLPPNLNGSARGAVMTGVKAPASAGMTASGKLCANHFCVAIPFAKSAKKTGRRFWLNAFTISTKTLGTGEMGILCPYVLTVMKDYTEG